MSFNPIRGFSGSVRNIALLLIVTAVLPSCGIFGSKKDRSKVISPQSDGCYNELSKKVERFFKGTISEQEWVSTFDCVNDQIEFFKRFVRPSDGRGYTASDIGSLTRRFLITNQEVPETFIQGIFSMKASMVGGPVDIVSGKELDEFLVLSEVLRKESLVLLPLIRARVQDPTEFNNLALADALDTFGEKLGQHLETISGSIHLHKDVFIPFVRDLVRLTGGNVSLVDEYADFVRNMKVASAGGSSDVIEPKVWSILVRDCASFGGLYLAWAERDRIRFPKPAAETAFNLKILKRAQHYTDIILKRRGGHISLRELRLLVDTMPMDALNLEKREALKTDLPNIIRVAFRGREDAGMDSKVIANVVNLIEDAMRGQIHVQKIFEGLPSTVTVKTFEEEAIRYSGTLKSDIERREVSSLVSLAKMFYGLYPESGNLMTLSREYRNVRTENHLKKMHWFRVIIRHLFSIYATGPDNSGEEKNLAVITRHYEHILRAWKKAHPRLTPEQMAQKRFREANLFMPNSNGDKYMSEAEGTYYLAFLASSGSLAGKIFDTIVHERQQCSIVGQDELGLPAMNAQCFRDNYFSNIDDYWSGFPGLVAAYHRMSPSAKASLQKSMEVAARSSRNENPIGGYDIDSFAALPHYVEDVMERFDRDSSETLSKDEIFSTQAPRGAYYTFRGALRQFAGIKQDWLLKCAFSYLIKFGREPRGLAQKAHLLAWCAWKPFWKINADRGDLYQIIAMIGKKSGSSPLVETFRSLEREGGVMDHSSLDEEEVERDEPPPPEDLFDYMLRD